MKQNESKYTPTCNKMVVLCWLFIRLLMDSNSLLIDSSNSVCSLPSYNLLRQALGYQFRIKKKSECTRFNCTRYNINLKIFFRSWYNIIYIDISAMGCNCYPLYWVGILQPEYNIIKFSKVVFVFFKGYKEWNFSDLKLLKKEKKYISLSKRKNLY